MCYLMIIIEISLKRILVAILVLLMVLCVVLSGCISEVDDTDQSEDLNKDTQTTDTSHWIRDSKGHFHTNDVNLAQREIPFTIVVPSYIPECFGTDYLYEITGPYIDEFRNIIEVKIRYDKDDYKIYISEQSRKSTMIPNEQLEPVYYDIFGTTPPDINITFFDSNLGEKWYQLDNGTITTNNYTWTGFIAQSIWDQVGNGTVIIRFYANDTVGNLRTTEVITYKDILNPIILISYPIQTMSLITIPQILPLL